MRICKSLEDLQPYLVSSKPSKDAKQMAQFVKKRGADIQDAEKPLNVNILCS